MSLSIWKMPTDGGDEVKVLDSVHPFALWTVSQHGLCYFTPPDAEGRSTLLAYDFGTRKSRSIFKTARYVGNGIGISPDERTVLYTQFDEFGTDLMLVKNFK